MILLKQADVYAPEHLGIKDVLVCGGKIEAVGDNLEGGTGCQVIDAKGMRLTPGLIDRHVHVTGGGGEGSFHTRTPQVELSSILKAGITTVLGLLGTDDMSRSVENLLAKVKALKEEGITAYALCGAYGYPPVTLTGSVKKDIAFVDEIMGLKLALSDHRAPNISVDELIRLGSDVRTAGMIGGKPGFIVLHMGSGKKKLSLASWLWNKVSGWISSIWDGICDFFGIASPSKEMGWVGEMLVEGLAGAINANGKDAVAAAEGMSSEINDVMHSLADDMTTALPTDFTVNGTVNRNDTASGIGGMGYGALITIQQMVVRSEEDIRKISQELYNLIQSGSRAQGHFTTA